MTENYAGAAGRKIAIRRELLLKRRALNRDEWLERSDKAVGFMKEMQAIGDASSVHCYVSMEKEREIATEGLLAWMLQQGKTVCMPYIEDRQMLSVRYMAGQRFRPARLGPPEPEQVVLCEGERFDVVVVPLVGVDFRGVRIGYGKGWYDRFLHDLGRREIHPLRIGLAFDFQVVPELPSDPWDERLDCVVTDNGVILCDSNTRGNEGR